MRRPKTRRRSEQHHINAAREQLLIRIESDELILGIDLHLRGAAAVELAEALIDAVLINVGDRGELGVIVGFECLGGGAGTSPAAADQADLNRVRRLASK